MCRVLRANKEVSLKGTGGLCVLHKRGSPVSAATCLVQAAGIGEPVIMGKRREQCKKSL